MVRYKQSCTRIVSSLNNNVIYSYAITISALHSSDSINNLNGERVEFGETSQYSISKQFEGDDILKPEATLLFLRRRLNLSLIGLSHQIPQPIQNNILHVRNYVKYSVIWRNHGLEWVLVLYSFIINYSCIN